MKEPIGTVENEKSVDLDHIVQTLNQDVELTEYEKQINSLAPRVKEFYNERDINGIEESTELPEDSIVFLFGDIHARNQSLSKAITELDSSCRKNGTTLEEKLDNQEAVFAFVGDYVHSETNEDSYQEAETEEDRNRIRKENLNTVMALMEMKLRFPDSIFLVKGNHDVTATKHGAVKFEIEQGEALRKSISESKLEEPLNDMLNRLPILSLIKGPEDKRLLVSHTLPIGNNGLPPLEVKKDLESDINKADDEMVKLFVWSRVRDLDRKIDASIKTYLYLSDLIKNTFGKDKESGKNIPTEKISWIVGHENWKGVSDNFADTLVGRRGNIDNMKLYQLNDQDRLPILLVRAGSIDKKSVFEKPALIRI